jgi:hypothetical protein
MARLKTILFIILALTWTVSFSQTDNQEEYTGPALPTEGQYFNLSPKANPIKHSLPFKNIIIIDSRLDNSSKIGYFNHRKDNKSKKICLSDDLNKVFTRFINSNFKFNDTSTSGSIYAYIKNFRINVVNTVASLNMQTGYMINLKAEFYLQKESCYFPLYRFDSTGSGRIDFPKDADEILSSWINAAFGKLSLPNTLNLQRKSCLSSYEVDSFNLAGRKHPLLSAKQYSKGIFMTIEEFRQNKPGITEFRIERSDFFDRIYAKAKDKSDSVILDAFGYSDGKKVYIRHGSSFFTLIRSGDGFEFHGFDNETVDALNKSGGGGHLYLFNGGRTKSFNENIQRGLPGFLGLPDKKITLQVWHLFDIATGNIY